MTTSFPTQLDRLATSAPGTLPPEENPHHRAVLDAFLKVQDLDQQITALDEGDLPEDAGAVQPAPSAIEAVELLISSVGRLERLTDLLLARIEAGQELTRLLSTACCCDAAEDAHEEAEEDVLLCVSEAHEPVGIVHAALEVFAAAGDPDAMSSADLTEGLRELPGIAEGRWRYADLTPARLAQLLAPYEVSTRDITLPGGQRRKSYRRGALLAALPGCSC
jgi:hypothetical protein